MILSNREILKAISAGKLVIDGVGTEADPAKPPFNTSAVDLRLAPDIVIPSGPGVAVDLRNRGIIDLLTNNSKTVQLTPKQPYSLERNEFILAKTKERVAFPISEKGPTYSARIEGKSSFARCGMLVHFTAPTIHAGFEGTITLEIINLGAFPILLYPDMYICQLIIEEVKGTPAESPNQFKGQSTPAGKKA